MVAAYLCRVFLMFIYFGLRKRVGIPLTSLTTPHCCACPKPRHVFPTSYAMVFFMFNDLMWELVVHVVDIGGIIDQHCLNFLLFCWYWWNYWPALFKLSFHISVCKVEFKPYLLEDRRPKSTQKNKIDCGHMLRYWEQTNN